jgi:hypothetical protein
MALDSQVGKKRRHLSGRHLQRMALVMKENETPNPTHVCVFGAHR